MLKSQRRSRHSFTFCRGYWVTVCLWAGFTLAGCGGAPMTPTSLLTSRPEIPFAALSPTTTSIPPAIAASAAPSAQVAPPVDAPTRMPATASASRTSPVGISGLPDPRSVHWVEVVNGLDDPVGLANAGDGSGRLFILERAGKIRLIAQGQLAPDPYLDITDRVSSQGSEQGLLGLAFHPQFKQNGYFYINYTDTSGNTVITRFHADPAKVQADPASQHDLLHVEQPYANHNGGSMVFGPDGYLYMGLGDGGSQGDPKHNGQSLQTLLGKLLRVDVDHGDAYTIPPDNPFAKGGGRAEIWAYGLRNPWRFDFDPQTHDLYIADVGQDTWEEIDFLPAGAPGGANFGWSYREGSHDYQGNLPTGLKVIEPVFEYSHDQGGCSVIGGVVYRGQALADWQAVYIFGDYCSGKVWGLRLQPDRSWLGNQLFDTGFAITSFGRDERGEVYLVDQHGSLVKLVRS
ncbi:MAG: PQQ-dependent sugar dehydrogenase [Anaerolineaceae bacterium]|nr:PQQ-dependent sugar dehydrogenase [Anaerolineaceae bacterium]